MKNNPSFRAIFRFLLDLTDDQIDAFLANKVKVKQFLSDLVDEAKSSNYFTPLSDPEIVHALIGTKRYTREQAEALVAKWRKLATEYGYAGPVAWRVREGFTLKEHAPMAGKVYENFAYLQDWQLQNDEPTRSAIVFWIPRLLNDSKSKTVDQQRALMAETRQRHDLPAHHLQSFGSAALLIGLVLAHFKRTGERTPLNCEWARTDTLRGDGSRLRVGGFGEAGPRCNDRSDGDSLYSLGVFAVGVELD